MHVSLSVSALGGAHKLTCLDFHPDQLWLCDYDTVPLSDVHDRVCAEFLLFYLLYRSYRKVLPRFYFWQDSMEVVDKVSLREPSEVLQKFWSSEFTLEKLVLHDHGSWDRSVSSSSKLHSRNVRPHPERFCVSLCYLCACSYAPIDPSWWEQKRSFTGPNDTQLLQFSNGLPTHICAFLPSFFLSFIFGMRHNSPMALLWQENEGIHRTASSETQALLDL